MSVKFAHRMEYVAARVACAVLMFLPYRVVLGLAWGIMSVAWTLNHKLRARTQRRLRQALGTEKTDRELARIARRAFRNLVFTAVEGLRLPGIGRKWVERNLGAGPVTEIRAQLAPGQGFIVAVPHLGNWELAGIALHTQGIELMTLVRRQKNPLMDAWINRLRRSTGVEAIDNKTRAVGEVVQKLRAGKVLALLPDVRAKVGGVPARYLGATTEVPAGAARFAREAGVPIFTGEVVRHGWTRIRWRGTGRIDSDPSLDEATDRQRIMQAIMDRFTDSVRAHPDSYFWFNKRWVLGAEETP